MQGEVHKGGLVEAGRLLAVQRQHEHILHHLEKARARAALRQA
jgi:hypothetical protein